MSSPTYPARLEALNKAIAKAQKSFSIFWRELSWEYRRIVPGLELAAIKAPFSDTDDRINDDDVEHLWLNDVTFDGETLQANVLNSPNHLKSVKASERVTLTPDIISDWIYAISGKVYGGFTINHIRSELSPAELKQHDTQWGLNFFPPEEDHFVPADYLGTPKTLKTGLFGLGKVKVIEPSQSLDFVKSFEHPMAVNAVESFSAQFKELDSLNIQDETGLTILHSMALAGATGIVKACLALGADPSLTTIYGATAEDLARKMGWSETVNALEVSKANWTRPPES